LRFRRCTDLLQSPQSLLATYERKQRDALQEAEAMVAHAEEEAKREAAIAAQKLEESIKRREQQALDKIALAEAQAEKEVREAAVEVAVDAAGRVIATKRGNVISICFVSVCVRKTPLFEAGFSFPYLRFLSERRLMPELYIEKSLLSVCQFGIVDVFEIKAS
jgi:hypothetical protein